MKTTLLVPVLAALAGCTTGDDVPVTVDDGEAGFAGTPATPGATPIPDVTCAGEPATGAATGFDHASSKLVAALGAPKHRGLDLVAGASATTQTIAGAASYGTVDKALEDETVELFACRAGAWQSLGTTRTDGEGDFSLALTGADRLPIGLRDMFVSIAGDRTGTRFLAYVAPDGAALLVSDVDGTLTESELAFGKTLATGADIGFQPGAPMAFADALGRGYQPVYLTSRGQSSTALTRDWLDRHAFPRGPLRLAPSFMLPGAGTVAFKTEALQAFQQQQLSVEVGVGNRATDTASYNAAGIPGARTFILTTEFPDESAPDIAAGKATGFTSYDALRTSQIASLPPK